MVKGTDLPLPKLRLHERRWNTCPECGYRGFRRTDHDAMQCLNCSHTWRERPGDYAQASKKAKPAKLREDTNG